MECQVPKQKLKVDYFNLLCGSFALLPSLALPLVYSPPVYSHIVFQILLATGGCTLIILFWPCMLVFS